MRHQATDYGYILFHTGIALLVGLVLIFVVLTLLRFVAYTLL